MGTQRIPSTLLAMMNHKHLRKILSKRIDDYIYKHIVECNDGDLLGVRTTRYEFLSAMLSCVMRNMDKGYVSADFIRRLTKGLVENNLIKEGDYSISAVDRYKEKYGELPPAFIVISPTQQCNLRCIGCYAASGADTHATVPFSYVERIVKEAYEDFGCRFITFSGGEPFMYKSEGKTMFDIFAQYPDVFFLIYTNGTLIDEGVAEQLARMGNATPAISVEGFEKETDERRGTGTFKKILRAFENLRRAGVPFGASATATCKNVDLMLKDEFYDFYFQQQGACYMWQFQLMPIGRGKDEMGLMVEPRQRIEMFRKWQEMLRVKKYCIADFWNSGVLARGCIAYGRDGGYIYIDWNGNITPCVFIPYSTDNIYDVYKQGRTLTDVLMSDFMKNGRRWQREYGLDTRKRPKNWLMPCSFRDHYENFRKVIMPAGAKPSDKQALEAMQSKEYYEILKNYDDELERLTEKIWVQEYLNADVKKPSEQFSKAQCV